MEATTETLKECTARIVTNYVKRHPTQPTDLPGVITTVYTALTKLGSQPKIEGPLVPAISIRRSLRPDAIICLDCGFKGKMLRRHLRSDHGMTPEEYRTRWGLTPDYPMTAPNYTQQRSDLAKETGLGRVGNYRGRVAAAPAPQPQAQPPEPEPQAPPAETAPKATRRSRAKTGDKTGDGKTPTRNRSKPVEAVPGSAQEPAAAE